MSKIVNSAAGNSLFSPATGAALATQPTLDKTTTIGGNFSSTKASGRSASGKFNPTETTSPNLFGYLETSEVAKVGTVSVVYSAGLVRVTTSGNSFGSLKVGDWILTNKNIIAKLTYVTLTQIRFSSYKSTTPGDYVQDGAVLVYKINSRVFDKVLPYSPVSIGATTKVGLGAANDAIKSGSTTPNRSLNKKETIKTLHTATAIRAGYWNVYTGEFSIAPTAKTDITSETNIASDNISKSTFTMGGKPTSQTY